MAGSHASLIPSYGWALISIAVATWVRLLLDPMLGHQFPFLTIFPAILVSAWYGGLFPSLFAVGIGALSSRYFIMPPRGSFSLGGLDTRTGMVLYLLTGVGIALLGGAMKRAIWRAEANALAIRRHATTVEQANRRFVQAMESAFNAELMVSASGLITMVNAKAEQLFGYARAELLGQPVEILLPERWRGRHPEHRAAFMAHPEVRSMGSGRDLTARRKDGAEFPVEISLNPISTEVGVEVLCSIVDITVRKRVEDALRTSEAQLRLFVEQAPVSIALLDRELRYVANSRRWIVDYGRGHDHLVGRCHYDIHPDVPERWKEIHRRGLAGESQRCDDDVWVRADGQKSWLRWAVHPWVDMRGTIGGIIIFAEDITARKHDEELLHKQQQQLALITANMPGPLALLDSTARYVFVNRIFEQWVSKPASEIIGRTVAEVVGPEAAARGQPYFNRALAGEQIVYENHIKTPTGEVFHGLINITAQRAVDGSISSFIVVGSDISELKRAERALREANDALEKRVQARTAALEAANKELEAFSYSVSHDLRAPLRAIDGFSRIIVEDFSAGVPGEVQEYLQDIRANTKQMGRLIDDLLAFARLSRQRLSRQRIDTNDMVRSVWGSLRTTRERDGLELRLGELPPCEGDPSLFKQVWFNLIDNAVKYSGRCAQAIIEVGCRPESDPPVYYVRDNGVGFDMRYVHKLFGVFQRLHRAEEYAGTGVGLAIVQRIIHRHGGRIWAEAEPNRGATFYFTVSESGSAVRNEPAH